MRSGDLCGEFLLPTQKLSFSQKASRHSLSIGFALLLGAGALVARAQAPALLWRTNVGATLFAVDAQTNTYANSNGTVIQLNSSGAMLGATPACPLPSVAKRDTTGNYIFAGTFDGTHNLGGNTFVGGWTNWHNPGNWRP